MADVDLERLSGRQIRAAAEILRSSPRLLDATRSLLATRAEASGAEGYLARLDWFFVARHAPSGMAVGSSDDDATFRRDLVELVRHPEFPAALLRGDAFHVAHALTRLQADDRRTLAPAVIAAIRADLDATPEGLHAATAAVATIAADADAAGLSEARATLAHRLDAMATDKAGSDWGEQLSRLSDLVRSPYLGRHPYERTPPDSLLTVAQGDGFLERRLRDFSGPVVVLVVANRPLGTWQTSELQALRAKFPSTDVTIIVLLPRGKTEGAVLRPRSGDYLVATCDPEDWHDSSTGCSLLSLTDPRVFVLDTNTAIVDGDLGPSAGVIEAAIVRAFARPKFTPPGRGMDDTPAVRPTSQP
jgi:hypothetical protein